MIPAVFYFVLVFCALYIAFRLGKDVGRDEFRDELMSGWQANDYNHRVQRGYIDSEW